MINFWDIAIITASLAASVQCLVWLTVGVLLAWYLVVRTQLMQRIREDK